LATTTTMRRSRFPTPSLCLTTRMIRNPRMQKMVRLFAELVSPSARPFSLPTAGPWYTPAFASAIFSTAACTVRCCRHAALTHFLPIWCSFSVAFFHHSGSRTGVQGGEHRVWGRRRVARRQLSGQASETKGLFPLDLILFTTPSVLGVKWSLISFGTPWSSLVRMVNRWWRISNTTRPSTSAAPSQ